jgi:uncharacterized protein (DUF1501 family)
MHTDDKATGLLAHLEGLAKKKALTRRDFVLLAGAIGAGTIAASQLGPLRKMIAGGTAGGSADGIVVFIYLGGGNDGLNTVIPVDAQYNEYVRLRTKNIGGTVSSIAYPAPGTGRADDALLGDASIAFNPGFSNISSWYRSGKVGVIQGVGYANPSFSHFDSQDHWWAGTGSAGTFSLNPQSGWLGRYSEMAALPPTGLIAISGGTQPLAIRGMNASGLSLSVWSGPRLGEANSFLGDAHAAQAVSAMAGGRPVGSLSSSWAAVSSSAINLAPTINGATQVAFPAGASYIKRQMMMAANLINANIGTRVIHCEHGGFDTHENQRLDSKGNDWHRMLLGDLDESLGVLFSTLTASQRRKVTVMVYSEFGRRPEMNGTFGTDHGAASVSLVIGDNVKGGRFGEYPLLTDLDDENLRSNVDFRSVYSALLQQWLGVAPEPIIGAPQRTLSLFAAAPGDELGQPPTTTTTTLPVTTTSTTTTLPVTTTSLPVTTTTSPTTTTVAITSTTVEPTTTTTIASTTTTTVVDNPTTTIVTTTVPSSSSTTPSSTTSTTTPTTTTTSPATTTTSTTPTSPATTTTSPATTTTTSAPGPTSTTSTTSTTSPKKLVTPSLPSRTPSRSTPDTPNLVVDNVPIAIAVKPSDFVQPIPSPDTTTTTTSPPTSSSEASSTVTPPTTTTEFFTTSVAPNTTTTVPDRFALVDGVSTNRTSKLKTKTARARRKTTKARTKTKATKATKTAKPAKPTKR